MLSRARPGDIVLFRIDNSDWRSWFRPWSKLISWFQGSSITHVALLVNGAWGVVIDAYWPRVRVALLNDIHFDCFDWEIIRPKEVVAKDQEKAVKYAKGLIGKRYDTRSLFGLAKWLFIEKMLGIFMRDRACIEIDGSRFFCQELIAYCYHKAGVDLFPGVKLENGDPWVSRPGQSVPSDFDRFREFFVPVSSSGGTLDR